MLSRAALSGLTGLSLLGILPMAASAAPALLPVKPLAAQTVQSPVVQASFWGRPYPYGYTSWGRCIRYVPVETAWGVEYRRVSVCRARR